MLRIVHLKWLISLLIPAGAYFIVQAAVQADPSLNPHLPMFFAITLWAITVWATDILPAVPSAAAMTFLYLLCNVAPPPVIFGAWGAFLPWICFGALVLSEDTPERTIPSIGTFSPGCTTITLPTSISSGSTRSSLPSRSTLA